jgi:hypothetical protein
LFQPLEGRHGKTILVIKKKPEYTHHTEIRAIRALIDKITDDVERLFIDRLTPSKLRDIGEISRIRIHVRLELIIYPIA